LERAEEEDGTEERTSGSDELPASAPSTGKISCEREISRNGICGHNVPTCRIPCSKERLFEGAAMEAEGRRPSWLSTEVEVDAMAPNSRSFDPKDLSIER
jgi:hypothetical protein